MAIITISRGSYSRGKEVAEKLSKKLGYECISRDIILEASAHFLVPELKLVRALHDAPSILDRLTNGKDKYIAFFRSAFLNRIKNDNIIYHGLGGHYFIKEIPSVLKIRINADLEVRIREEMKRENISKSKARAIIKKDDSERRNWNVKVTGVDIWDPGQYDMILHINSMSVDDAVDIIMNTVSLPCFQTTPESLKILSDMALSAEVEGKLISLFPKAKVTANDGDVEIVIKRRMNLNAPLSDDKELAPKINEIVKKIAGVKGINITFNPFSTN
jgi:cytidylate kinase